MTLVCKAICPHEQRFGQILDKQLNYFRFNMGLYSTGTQQKVVMMHLYDGLFICYSNERNQFTQ